MDHVNARAVVPLDGRGTLVFEPLHDEPLYLFAVRTLTRVCDEIVVRVEADQADRVRSEVAGLGSAVQVLSSGPWWDEVRGAGAGPLLVHDPLCPLTPDDLLSSLLEQASSGSTSYAAVRPVTDTVKTAASGRITGTIDREGLVSLASPAVIAASVLEAADGPPPLDDLAHLVTWLRARGDLELVHAPSLARRVDDVSAVHLLECVDELGRQLRQARRTPTVSGGPAPRPRERA
ncbi:2-C-methyl-D-erythritol 4-phosphate cytidylyltransferase [Nocardioides cynanchi]|uniref:2-C-methyl-D-erythritol 4-phosphate cytidylyltransferase n=1 Tax=Nocardioides cynanchi TaxID=2558918 RepID=UPI001245E983|nr:2-C-methyl-D-erythritol 4-phosphate cytidylyltransferase [Nocardioides cynanchi]